MFTLIKNLAVLDEKKLYLNKVLIKIASLELANVKLNKDQTHLLRGCIGNLFKDRDIIHNHDLQTGKVIYRYPLIQFKIIDNVPKIIAISEEAINTLKSVLLNIKEIDIKGLKIPIYEKMFKVEEYKFGNDREFYVYEFVNPWIALNQENYNVYFNLQSIIERNRMLEKCLIAHIISVSKAFKYTVNDEIIVKANLNKNDVILKGKTMIGFTGCFKVNFDLPDFIGLGKSVSRGYGCFKKVI